MRKTAAVILFIGVVCIFSGSSYASNAFESANAKCAVPRFEQAYKDAKAVFVGEVINIEEEGDKKIVEFKVKKYWKGIEDTKIKVTVNENFRFQSPYEFGENHLVFAKLNEDSGELWDGRCSRSKDLEGFSPDLKGDLKSLGKAKTCISLDSTTDKKRINKQQREK